MALMNETPSGERVHIGFFGRRNAGKSSIVNAVTGQELAVVSDVKGTTTDPVTKSMEILPLGPVVVIDTPGFDDEGSLGELRVERTRRILEKTDIAVLVMDAAEGMKQCDAELTDLFIERKIPYIIVLNKSDLLSETDPKNIIEAFEAIITEAKNGNSSIPASGGEETENRPLSHVGETGEEGFKAPVIVTSAMAGSGIEELKNSIAALRPDAEEKHLIADKISAGDIILLVVPIDKAAPKGRLILPQQQTIRDILDAGACAMVVRDSELAETLEKLGAGKLRGSANNAEVGTCDDVDNNEAGFCGNGDVGDSENRKSARPDPERKTAKPALVITDSQVFGKVDKIVPDDIPLTSFSILMARHKGLLDEAVKGIAAFKKLKDGDKVLIAEGCTHHRQCGDIGRDKIPRWIADFTGKKLDFEMTSGGTFPADLSKYALIVHCGGCMLNEREVGYRVKSASGQSVPITNYGTLIAHVNGILARSLGIFPELEYNISRGMQDEKI